MPKVLIDISEEELKRMRANTNKSSSDFVILNGIVLDRLTNGEVMKKMFPYAKVTHTEDWTPDNSKDLFKREFVMVDFGEGSVGFNSLWWNSKWGE